MMFPPMGFVAAAPMLMPSGFATTCVDSEAEGGGCGRESGRGVGWVLMSRGNMSLGFIWDTNLIG